MDRKRLVSDLVKRGFLKTPRIIEAFEKIDRRDFIPEVLHGEAYVNAPLPIGWGQTISQPLTVAFMLELLGPKSGEKILDIGSGSGWQTALLAHIVGKKGNVYAVERISELRVLGERNAAKYGLNNITFFLDDGAKGLPEFAPYDRVIAAASAKKLPQAWKEQVRLGGYIVAPVGSSVWQYDKVGEDAWAEKEYPGFAFVPLIEGE